MNAIEMIGERQRKRVEALGCLGYTEREAAFLCLVGLYSGYFMRRQYVQFVGKAVGGTAAMLIEKVLAHEHAKALTYSSTAQIYHLFSRPFYAALSECDNRNRRDRRPLTIKTKLMALDFVLAHLGNEFLATEQEKVDCFATTWNIEPERFPAAVYHGRIGESQTVRYFVDKFPVYTESSRDDGHLEPAFCYIDGGATTVCGFETYLEKYRPLFSELPRFRVVYVAARPLLFRPAERTFQRFVRGSGSRFHGPNDAVSGDLHEYFQARFRYESGELASFDRAKLIRLRDLRSRFSGDQIEAQFECWRGTQTLSSTRESTSQAASGKPLPGTFSVCLLAHNYDLFGNLTSF